MTNDIIPPIKDLLLQQERSLRKVILWVLKELHQESNANLSERSDFIIRSNEKASPDEQRRAIRFLENIGAIQIIDRRLSISTTRDAILSIDNEINGATHQTIWYRIKLNTADFKGIYDSYENFFKEKPLTSFIFDSVSGTLKFGKHSIRFSPESHSFAILSVLFNNTDGFYALGDALSFREINQIATNDGSINEIPNKSFYNAQKYINKQAEKVLGVKDLLILRDAMIGINNTYIKSTQ